MTLNNQKHGEQSEQSTPLVTPGNKRSKRHYIYSFYYDVTIGSTMTLIVLFWVNESVANTCSVAKQIQTSKHIDMTSNESCISKDFSIVYKIGPVPGACDSNIGRAKFVIGLHSKSYQLHWYSIEFTPKNVPYSTLYIWQNYVTWLIKVEGKICYRTPLLILTITLNIYIFKTMSRDSKYIEGKNCYRTPLSIRSITLKTNLNCK